MNRSTAFIGIIAALLLAGCAEAQGTSGSSGANSAGSSETSAVIGISDAEKAALDHAGFTADRVTFTKTEYGRGGREYEIEFTADGYKYEYDISAADGGVIEFSKELISDASDAVDTSAPTTPPPPATDSRGTQATTPEPPQVFGVPSAPAESGRITLEEAKAAALKHAGVTAEEATFIKTKLDRDDGREEYDIEFMSNDYEYDYEIDASSGAVLSNEKEARSGQPAAVAAAEITLDEAKNAALKHAGVTADKATFTKTKLDNDDGRKEYDIEFVTDDYEYEYEIDASSGAVLSNKKEARSRQAVAGSADRITLDEAKAAALAHAGVSAEGVTFIKTKLDRDDEEYDIEFVSDDHKYEYEIDARSGAVLSDSMKQRGGQTISGGDRVTLDEAKAVVLGHAGFDASEVTFTKTKLKRGDDGEEYDIEFYANGREYEYSVDAATGEITEYEADN